MLVRIIRNATHFSQFGPCTAAIYLRCPKEIMIDRLLQRSKTSGRIDDTLTTFEKRYEGYLKDSLPVVDHLKEEKTKLIEVSSNFRYMLMRKLNMIDILGRKWRARVGQI